MNPNDVAQHLTRRSLLSRSALGLGALAAGDLLTGAAMAGAPNGVPRLGRARAKQVIFVALSGAPPQIDLFDPKPELQRLDGTLAPERFFADRRLAFIKGHPTLLGSPFSVRRSGQSGLETPELMPHLGRMADHLCVVRSMHTDEFNHAPADLLLYAGNRQVGGAAMGAWSTYGLGSMNADLPGFVVMISGGSDPTGGKATWGAGYLPPQHQGVRLRSSGEPVLYVGDPPGLSREGRRSSLDALRALNELGAEESGDPEARARIEQFELAYRMQAAVPELADLTAEPPRCWRSTVRSPARDRSPTTACWLADSSSAACAGCSCTTGAGICTARGRATTCCTPSRTSAPRWTGRSRRCSPTSTGAACWTRPS